MYTEIIVYVLMVDNRPYVIYTRKHNFGLNMNFTIIYNGADICHSFIYLSFVGEIHSYIFTFITY
jgi:hypothetical protein